LVTNISDQSSGAHFLNVGQNTEVATWRVQLLYRDSFRNYVS